MGASPFKDKHAVAIGVDSSRSLPGKSSGGDNTLAKPRDFSVFVSPPSISSRRAEHVAMISRRSLGVGSDLPTEPQIINFHFELACFAPHLDCQKKKKKTSDQFAWIIVARITAEKG